METYKKKMSAQKNTAVLVVSLFLLLMVNNCIGGLNDFVKSCMLNYLENRTLMVGYSEGQFDYDKVRSFIGAQEEVQAYFESGQHDVTVEDIYLDGESAGNYIRVEVYSAEVMGSYMTDNISQLADNEVIVGKYTNFGATGIVDIHTDTKMIDMESYIGKMITCKIVKDNPREEKEYSFRIAGVFDNIKAGKPGVFYVNEKMHHDMLDVCDFHISITDDNGVEVDRQRMIYFQVTTKNKDTIEILRSKIKQEFYGIITLHPINYPDIVVYFLTGMILVGNFIIFFFLINSISSVIYVTEDMIYKRRREFGILKAIGYRDKDLRNLLLKESLRSSGKAIVVSALAGFAAFGIFRLYVRKGMNLYFTALSFSIKPHTFLLYFLTAFGVPLIGFWYGYRHLKNLSVIDTLRSE